MKYNTKKKVVSTVNLAGGKANKLNSKMELIFAVLSTFLKDEFYESGDSRAERIKDLIQLVDDPLFVAQLAVVARDSFNLRSVSHLLIGSLAKSHGGDSLVGRAIFNVTKRPDDLLEIASVIGINDLTNQFKTLSDQLSIIEKAKET